MYLFFFKVEISFIKLPLGLVFQKASKNTFFASFLVNVQMLELRALSQRYTCVDGRSGDDDPFLCASATKVTKNCFISVHLRPIIPEIHAEGVTILSTY